MSLSHACNIKHGSSSFCWALNGQNRIFFQFTCFTCEIFVFSVYNVLPWSVVSVFLSQTKVYQEHLKQTNKKNVQIIINNTQVTWLVVQRLCVSTVSVTDWEQSSLSHTRQHKHGCFAMPLTLPLAMPLAMDCASTDCLKDAWCTFCASIC